MLKSLYNICSEAISKSGLSINTKAICMAHLDRYQAADEKQTGLKYLIHKVSEDEVDEIVLSTDDVLIYKKRGKDEWDVKYPYRVLLFKDGRWFRIAEVSESLDKAMLIYLGNKYLDANQRFSGFAVKMLEIPNN